MSYSSEVLSDAPLAYYRLGDTAASVTVTAATASSNFSSEPPSNAFDGFGSTFWTTNGTSTGWLRAQLSTASVVTTYYIRRRDDIPARNPTAWTFEGSNDGSTWTTLDTQSGITWPTAAETKTFPISNSTAYLYYRLNITANGGDGYLSVADLGSNVWSTFMADSSGNGRHGAYSGAPTLGTTGLLVGDSDACVDFTGADYATGTTLPSTSSRTIECLIRPDAVTGPTRVFLDMDDGAGRMFQFRITPSAYLEFIAWNSTGGIFFATGTTAISAATTYHVAAVFDHVAGAATIYLNGSVYKTVAVTGTAANTGSTFRIGANASAGINSYIDGRIDEVAVYGTALSSTRIAAHYTAATTSTPTPATGTLAATLPAPTVGLAGTYVGPTAPTEGALAGALPVPTVSLSGSYDGPVLPVDGALAASLPVPTVALSGGYVPQADAGALAALLPLPTLALTGAYVAPLIVGTDTTSDVSLGYNYDGVGEVGDNLTPAAIPAGVNLAPIRRVHQSLPAPTLVNGRPT